MKSPAPALRLANLAAIEKQVFDPLDNGSALQPGVIYAANASRFAEAYLSEALQTYAVGFKDPNDIAATRRFFAPEVEVGPLFEYQVFESAADFLSETDDSSAVGMDYKKVEPAKSTPTLGKTEDRGLTLVTDLRTVAGQSGWEQRKVARLLRRIERNRLRRALALLSAAATNTAKTWDTSAGKDPDMDVAADLVTATNSSGVRPNRVGFGETAWMKRMLAFRAQDNAGGYASAGLSPEQLAAFLMLDKVLVSRERYQSAAAAKSEVLGNLVLMFNAMDGADVEDPSNIKCFVSKYEDGSFVRVYQQQLSANLVAHTVSYQELTKITSTLGIRKFTVS